MGFSTLPSPPFGVVYLKFFVSCKLSDEIYHYQHLSTRSRFGKQNGLIITKLFTLIQNEDPKTIPDHFTDNPVMFYRLPVEHSGIQQPKGVSFIALFK
uniref:Uncharacterized protein n=1 Tax=Leclercia adecarboxylata TaxID=83655 RepID=A0A4P8WAT3_9ENTR|nr:Hypothetical protein [Leclercia adecarboxylata]